MELRQFGRFECMYPPTISEIRHRISHSESQNLERKRAFDHREIRKTLVAFANSVTESEYGILFIGIEDTGNICGVVDADKMQKDIRRIADQDCYPPIPCDIQVIREGSSDIIAIIVPYSRERPHFAGPAYKRQGSESVNATKEQYEEMIASRHDKARRILASKGKQVSVERADGYLIVPCGVQYIDPLNQRDYIIDTCDAQDVKFRDTHGNIYSEPLWKLEIGFDPIRNRLKLFIKANDQVLVDKINVKCRVTEIASSNLKVLDVDLVNVGNAPVFVDEVILQWQASVRPNPRHERLHTRDTTKDPLLPGASRRYQLHPVSPQILSSSELDRSDNVAIRVVSPKGEIQRLIHLKGLFNTKFPFRSETLGVPVWNWNV